ncbi:hypothetical protein [Stappia sp.]|uniref:hypothetical protein n=1 Tax=Stappia sp. TaxID=1870903 RepID=UPI0032D9A879
MFQPQPARRARRRAPLQAAALALALVAASLPARADTTFGAFALICNEAATGAGSGRCALTVDGADAVTGEAAGRLELAPTVGAEPAWTLAFHAGAARPDDARAMQWEVDGRLVHVLRPGEWGLFGDERRFFVTDGAAGAEILGALKRGMRLRISYLDALGGAHDALFPLDGLAAGLAALRERAGDAALPERVAAPQGLPPVRPPSRAEAVTALGIPYAVLDRHARSSACEDPASARLADAEVLIAVLSPVATLYAIPCTAGGGRVTHRLYLRDSGEIGGVETLQFALHDPRFGWVGTDLLSAPSFEAESGRLSASYVGRSDRVCGYRASWQWRNYAFALESFEGPADCDDAERPERWRTIHP